MGSTYGCPLRLCTRTKGTTLLAALVILCLSHDGFTLSAALCYCDYRTMGSTLHLPCSCAYRTMGSTSRLPFECVPIARWDQPWAAQLVLLIIHIVESRTEDVVAEAAMKLKCAKLKAEEKRALTKEASLEQEWSPSTP